MKVLLYDTTNAFLTPGGKTIHAAKLLQEISRLGVDIQFSRWWDKSQEDADIIHFLATSPTVVRQAKAKGMKIFCSQIFDYESNKPELQKKMTIIKNKIVNIVPSLSSAGAYWKAFPYMDKIQFMHKYDMETALRYFPNYIDPNKVIVIPHAYDPAEIDISNNFDTSALGLPTKYLVSCANISPRKQSLKLARIAKIAKVPIVFLGSKSDKDSYYKEFEKEIDNRFVFYPGYVSNEWKDCIEKNASGYVLLSLGESGCIAVYEAAAYKLPLLLSNLPWAWGYDSPTDIYYCDQQDVGKAFVQLKDFWNKSKKLDHMPFKAMTWGEVALKYVEQYELLLK